MAADTQHTRVYCSLWFYDYLRKHVMSFFSWFSMTYLFPGLHCLPNTRVDHAWDCRVIFYYVPWFINTLSLLCSIDDNFNFIMILLSISIQMDWEQVFTLQFTSPSPYKYINNINKTNQMTANVQFISIIINTLIKWQQMYRLYQL